MEEITNTLQCLGETQHDLGDHTQNYLDDTAALQSGPRSCSLSDNSIPEQYSLSKAHRDDVEDLANFQAQTHPNRAHNSFLPINALPLEILLKIFWFSAFHSLHTRYSTSTPNPYQQDDRKDLLVLTHVCRHWRKVMLAAQFFWSRFEFDSRENPVTASERARAYLERAPDAPLSFYINEHWEHPLEPAAGDNPLLEQFAARFDRLRVISLMNLRNSRLARDIILSWMKSGKPGTMHTLVTRMDIGYWHDEVIDTRDISVTRQRADSLLASIRVLYLDGLRFDWNSPAYHNLVVLRIGGYGRHYSPYIHEMLAILSACPQLHTLLLSRMFIRSSDLEDIEPVYLAELEYLSLTDLSPESFSLLLPAIFPQSKNLTFRVSLPELDETIASHSVRLFLGRTNVTRIFIQQLADHGPHDISRYLSALPNLHTLILHFSRGPDDEFFSSLTCLDESKGAACPRLHTMYLVDASFSNEVIQQIVEAHHIQKLRFLNCNVMPSKDELHRWLEPRVKDVHFGVRLDSGESVDWYHLMD